MEIIIEPWPYGSLEPGDNPGRYFQGVIYARDTRSGNEDSNFYSFPVPIIPVVDYYKRELVRIEKLATAGKGDSLTAVPRKSTHNPLDHCRTAEYVPELLENGTRKDLKELNVLQPDGPSFTVRDDSLVEWQKWRFRVGFTPREGVVIHDIYYDNRSLFYRLSISEMVSFCLNTWCVDELRFAKINRLYRTRTLEHLFTESRHSILEKEELACAQITWH